MSTATFDALRQGVRFPASRLATEHEALAQFWTWWWSQAPTDQLTRPETLEAHDPWLTPTAGKEAVDTQTYAAFLSQYLFTAQRSGYLPDGACLDRKDYRERLLQHVFRHAHRAENPLVVFVGGGYGSGKTTILDMLVKAETLPIPRGSVIGVDYFKAYLPEFSFLQRLCDGRASSVVQEEARSLSNCLFDRLVRQRLSFGWDSSMSDPSPSKAKLEQARSAGYNIVFIAVFTPLAVAVRQAMSRARQSRRFAHPTALPQSHVNFRAHWRTYIPYCDEIMVFENEGTPPGSQSTIDPRLIARQIAPNRELAILDQTRFERAVLSENQNHP